MQLTSLWDVAHPSSGIPQHELEGYSSAVIPSQSVERHFLIPSTKVPNPPNHHTLLPQENVNPWPLPRGAVKRSRRSTREACPTNDRTADSLSRHRSSLHLFDSCMSRGKTAALLRSTRSHQRSPSPLAPVFRAAEEDPETIITLTADSSGQGRCGGLW
jgi:hypothetical protein